jgi:hypothetical protein
VNRTLGHGLRLEIGYVNQFVNGHGGQPDVLRHIALVSLDYVW